MLNKILVVSLLIIAASSITFSQSNYKSKEERLAQLKSREDIKVTEVEKDILKLEYPNGKVLYKNIADYQYQESSIKQPLYSPTYDSTIIDLTTIDTTLYYQMYSFWQEVPLTNFDFSHLMVGDVNNNGKTELYGARKFFETPTEPVCIYELDESDRFQFKYQYDSVSYSWNIYDLDNDGSKETHFLGYIGDQRFFSKNTDTSFATTIHTSFIPSDRSDIDDSTFQVNDPNLGDYDEDGITDFLCAAGAGRGRMHIFEYNTVTNTFDSVYRYKIVEQGQLAVSGFSVGDFDLDGKTDIVFGTGSGKVHVVENQGNNQYAHVWLGEIESYHAYIHTWSHDIDRNGKPEFWVLGDAYYNGIGTTRITIFETNGDNSYQAVGRVDLVGVFSFYAGTLQAVDIDNDSTEEIAVCIDGNFLILKFNGNEDHQAYELYYIKQPENENFGYYGAVVNDLLKDGKNELLLSLFDYPPQVNNIRFMTRIYRTDSLTSVYESGNYIPNLSILHQNYPSPFNPSTNVNFILSGSINTSIKVFNVLGKEIRTLLNENLPSGEHTIQWDGKDNEGNILPGGVYFIQMIAGSYQKTIKTIFLK